MNGKNVFITGGTGGLGGSTVRYLAERGWRVFAADFDEAGLGAIGEVANVTPVHLDVTSAASVEAARRRVAAATDGLDGIVNFAGILALGSLVDLDEAGLGRVLDVNVMGTFRVNRALFPLALARKGRIVNISSETGWQSGMPFNGAYGMSKHAIEAYSDSLRRELVFLGIKVVKIQPGPFQTAMVDAIGPEFDRAIASSERFEPMLARIKQLSLKEQDKAHDPVLIARTVHTALTAARPRAAYSVKPDPLRVLLNRLPTRLADRLLARTLRP
jgi:NAD(P)-dependent dehydrogenase (short-subunit alcohol dehydrogenase family)